MFLSHFPAELEDLICKFAWKKSAKDVKNTLEVVLHLKKQKLPLDFYHSVVWSWVEQKFVPLPLLQFTPVGDFANFFNLPRIKWILMQLDFRKRLVKSMGNRVFWLNLLDNHWSFAVQFGLFYKILQKSPISPFCPTYEQERTRGIQRYWAGTLAIDLL